MDSDGVLDDLNDEFETTLGALVDLADLLAIKEAFADFEANVVIEEEAFDDFNDLSFLTRVSIYS